MNIGIKFVPSPGLLAMLKTGDNLSPVLSGAAEKVVDYLRDYHSKMDWRESRWMPPSLGFAKKVVEGWQPLATHTFGTERVHRITIVNTFGLLAWKVSGGDISPVNAEFLTIPLISEAKGKSVAEFRAGASEPFFRLAWRCAGRSGASCRRSTRSVQRGIRKHRPKTRCPPTRRWPACS